MSLLSHLITWFPRSSLSEPCSLTYLVMLAPNWQRDLLPQPAFLASSQQLHSPSRISSFLLLLPYSSIPQWLHSQHFCLIYFERTLGLRRFNYRPCFCSLPCRPHWRTLHPPSPHTYAIPGLWAACQREQGAQHLWHRGFPLLSASPGKSDGHVTLMD